ncbi:hypothetical_protein (plasmid) [Leishmania braziliensis MHOM/BR/75/M2904]|uniref:Hypothetical_protein n=1 Tax=Leishmania braziliensis MHOM/BR/75/M2904 TaxID=420245 RepID=A0A3P3Z699_LEIBR|nr:unnamed protein product [Leishmania braziliensis]SYZ65767.1 hypothetical_protein [Leishmania braziliensis MHOM/BR/75/M2904]
MIRFRGNHYKQLLTQLPRNLLVFDGHCLLCQARVRYVLERNFSFFSLLSYVMCRVEDDLAEGLDRHRIYFASLDSKEGANVRRLFFQRTPSSSAACASSSAAPPQPVLPVPEDLVLVFIEKVPSQTAKFLACVRPGGVAADDRTLFQNTTTAATYGRGVAASASTTSSSSTASARLVDAAETDLFVSTNYTAMCRVGMHLDRFLIRLLFRFLYCAVPTSMGDYWFERYVCCRRKNIWGTSEQDAVKVSGIIEGMVERRWVWRGVSSNPPRR